MIMWVGHICACGFFIAGKLSIENGKRSWLLDQKIEDSSFFT